MRPVTESLYKDVYEHVVDCDRLKVVQDEDQKPIAFLAVSLKSFKSLEIYHLEGIITAQSVQGNGLAKSLLESDLGNCESDVLAFHTQSILMKKLGEKVSNYDHDLSVQTADLIGTRDLQLISIGPIDKGRYGGSSLYGDVKSFEPIAIKGEDFDFLYGDAIVFAGYIKKSRK